MLGWESLDQRRNYTKSIYMYKIINDHAAPNLKQLFRRCNEGDNSLYDLRNSETDLILLKPKKEFLQRSLKYNGAIHWNNLSAEAKNADSIHSFKRIIKSTVG